MPAIRAWSYIEKGFQYSVLFYTSSISVDNSAEENFILRELKVDEDGSRRAERFRWSVQRDGVVVASRFVDIDRLSGRVCGGDMAFTSETTSIIDENLDIFISFGFYEAPSVKWYGLPAECLCYVTVSRLGTRWMGRAAPVGEPQAQKSFSRFVLPAPHDCGMNTMRNCEALIKQMSPTAVVDILETAGWTTWITLLQGLGELFKATIAYDAVYNVSVTQKDTFMDMLEAGARYFEFRPAKNSTLFRTLSTGSQYVGLPDRWYFQHALFPGDHLENFLDQVIAFLDDNQTEIVVLHLRWDNVHSTCLKPSGKEIEGLIDAALKRSRTGIKRGCLADSARPIDDLRSRNMRHLVAIEAAKYDSYTSQAYQTLTSDTIVNAFESMSHTEQLDTDLTVMQCQGTPQGKAEVLLSTIGSSPSNSPLLATKAMFDPVTLGWLSQKSNIERFDPDKLMIVMNDFIEVRPFPTVVQHNELTKLKGATVSTAIDMSLVRFGMEPFP
ncbi:hypothetical protein PV08_11967 [Exophiala spinifera]|uniref:PLC-like phosphodiesterase n=1 Tax=Exophiala spinifera TaxID=91928 RepID=A0A0D1Y4K1_9EURO|nr:uncharacterized protein PV08_11967 [Exophiala spinifera]KIW09866.1 hypothetical protein PV08_11967 [Exophiala spinifera]